MEQIKEAVYLINDERYLHLRENGAGVGFATYNKVTGEPLESGQISEKNLPPDGQNTIPAARNWYLFSRIFTLSCWMALQSSSESSNRYQFRAAEMAFLPSGGRFFSEICPLSSGSPVALL